MFLSVVVSICLYLFDVKIIYMLNNFTALTISIILQKNKLDNNSNFCTDNGKCTKILQVYEWRALARFCENLTIISDLK